EIRRAPSGRDRQFRGGVAQQPRGARAGSLRAHQCPGHANAARSRARATGPALSPHLDLRGLRRSRARLGRGVHGGVPISPTHTVQRLEGRGGPHRPGVPRDFRARDDGHDRRYLLDHSKITQELGWRPAVPFEQGIRETVGWYADNRPWWEPKKRAMREQIDEFAWVRPAATAGAR